MIDSIKDSKLENITSSQDPKILKIENSIQSIKLDVDDILSMENISNIIELFKSSGFEDYYDFYFIEMKKFNLLLSQNRNLREIFKKIIGKENINNSYTSNKQLLMFAERIGYEKIDLKEIRNKIISDLDMDGIHSINQLTGAGLINFKKRCLEKSYLRYFIFKKLSKSYANLDISDFEIIGNQLGLPFLEEVDVIYELSQYLKENGIETLEDFENISIKTFKEIITNSNLFLSFIKDLGIIRKDMKALDKELIGKKIGLKNKENNSDIYIRKFLRDNRIYSYQDLIDLGINGARDFLGADKGCRKILTSLGIKYLKDFREDDIKRFSRRVGLDGVPIEKETNENETISKIKLLLINNGIECSYSLKLKGIKLIKNILKEKNIGKVVYKEINEYIKSNFGFTIPGLKTENIDELSQLLGLNNYEDKYYKQKLILYLQSEGIDLESLSKNKIKTGYWSNIYIRYFLEKVGITDVKLLRLEHMRKMKEYIENI